MMPIEAVVTAAPAVFVVGKPPLFLLLPVAPPLPAEVLLPLIVALIAAVVVVVAALFSSSSGNLRWLGRMEVIWVSRADRSPRQT